MTLFLLELSLLPLFLRWLSCQNLCPKTVDNYVRRLALSIVYPSSGGAKVDIYLGLCKLIPDFVVRMVVIHVHGNYNCYTLI